MSSKLLVIVGSGPGIAVNTATVFASNDFSIALISRNAERLESDVTSIRKASNNTAIKIETYPTDVGDTKALKSTFSKIEKDLGKPEVVLFNAARIEPSDLLGDHAEAISQDFQVMNIGLYETARWAVPLLESNARQQGPHPCLFLSGGAVYENPVVEVFALCMQKAAQHNLMKSLWIKQGDGKGKVHVAVANIGGVVKDDDPIINAKNIAQTYCTLYNEDVGEWRHRVDIGVSN